VLPWDSNDPEIISAFEAYCREGAEEGGDYVPYAIVRRHGGLERVGRRVRPWGAKAPRVEPRPLTPRETELMSSVYATPGDDAPRAVLADWWLSHDDPRGELVRLQLSGEDMVKEETLLAELGRQMMGSLGPAVALDGVTFRRGFLAEVEVTYTSASQAQTLAADPVWGTVERLHFLDSKHQALHPAMTALKSVSGLSKRTLQEVVASGATYPIEDLAVNFSVAEAAQILKDKSCFPELVRLEGRLGRATGLFEDLPQTVRTVGVLDEDIGGTGALVEALPAHLCLELVFRPDLGRLAGWRHQLTRSGAQTKLRCVLDNYLDAPSLSEVQRVRRALPGEVTVELVPSRYLDPRPEDLRLIESEEDLEPDLDY
jgi:uncharacterized protein (TIGR02996 family)